MRNLKKVLSLVLALAMVLSICMVGAGAVDYDNFTDKESITKAEAVATLVNLDVINGYNDGKEFRPQGNVTRAEMVTMICRVLAGGDNMIPDATKPVPTYTDVRNNPSAAWAETYIEYCTSLGIVSGKGNGIFDPMADVTAAEASKMVMTAVGYNADIEQFKGIGWDINTMAKASTLKLLTNLVGEISANTPVTREQVAQLIYNAMTIPMVQNYNGSTANLWIGSGANAYQETLMEKSFNAKKVTGVVIANEWASLLDTRPIGEGKTMLWILDDEGDIAYEGNWAKFVSTKEFQDETLTINASTTLEQVGSSITVLYKTDTRQNIFGIVMDSGLNNVVEFTKGGDVKTPDLDFGTRYNTQYFVNYDDEVASYTASDYRLKYVVLGSEADMKKLAAENLRDGKELGKAKQENGNTWSYTREIEPDENLTSFDIDCIEHIFRRADLVVDNTALTMVNGEVYVGTQSTEDISDTISWREFRTKYLSSTERANAWFDKIENGNYAKLVDCDNDGVAEFAFKIEYTLDEVASVKERDGKNTYTFVGEGIVQDGREATVDRLEILDDLAKGDIIVYTIIDGIAHIELADVVTGTIRTVNYRDDSITTTDGDVYEQSGIYNDTGYAEYIADMDEKVAYNMFLDKYGYVRAYKLVDDKTIYGLLTEAYKTNEYNNRYVKNEMGIVELKAGDERVREYPVFNYSADDGNVFFDGVHGGNRQTTPYRDVLTYADNMLGVNGYYTSSFANKGHSSTAAADDGCSNYDHFDWSADGAEADSRTNVARYVLNEEDGTVTLYSASKRATTKANKFLYYEEDNTGKYTGLKITEDDWRAAYKVDHPNATASEINNAWRVAALDPVMAVEYVQLAIQDLDKGDWRYDVDDNSPLYKENNNVYINGVHDTEYYLVQNNRIDYFTDYANLPKISADKINAIYAVAENTDADSSKHDYWVANVVVIELESWETAYDSIGLAYNNNSKTTSQVRELAVLDAETNPIDVKLTPTKVTDWAGQWDGYGFYELGDTVADKENVTAERIRAITEKFASYGIRAGGIVRAEKIDTRGGYIVVDEDNVATTSTDTRVNVNNVPVYVISDSSDRTDYRIDRYTAEDAGLETGDSIIWVCNKKGDVSYIVLVDDINGKKDSAKWVYDLFNDIVADKNKPTGPSTPTDSDYDKAMAKAEAAIKANTEKDYDEAIAALEALDNLTLEQADKVKAKIAELNRRKAEIAVENKRREVKKIVENFLLACQQEGEDITDRTKFPLTYEMVDFIYAMIDYRSTVSDVDAVFQYDPDALGEKYTALTYNEQADMATQIGAIVGKGLARPNPDDGATAASALTADGTYLKQDLMNCLAYDRNGLAWEKQNAKLSIDNDSTGLKSTYDPSNFTGGEWAPFEKLMSDAKTAIDAATTSTAVKDIYSKLEGDLAQKALDTAKAALEAEDAVQVADDTKFTAADIATAINTVITAADLNLATIDADSITLGTVNSDQAAATVTLTSNYPATGTKLTATVNITVTITP